MRLKHACADGGQYGVNVSPEEYQTEGVRMLRTSDLAGGSLATGDDGVYLEGPIPDVQVLQENDLLLSRAGTIGRSYLVPASGARMTFAGFLVRFRPKAISDPRFLKYAIRSKGVQEQIHAQAVTSTIQNFNAERYANLELPDASAGEQRRIADFLDDRVSRIDRIIAARREQIDRSRQAFDSWWDASTVQLGRRHETVLMRRMLRTIADGPFGSSLTSRHYTDAGTRVVRLGNIGIAAFKNEDQAFIANEYAETLSNHSVTAGDLVMAGLGDERWPLGRCAVVPEIGPAIVKADCYRIRLSSAVSHEFAAIALSSPNVRSRVAMLGRGATRARLNTEVAREAPLVVPPLDVQAAYHREWSEQRDSTGYLQAYLARSIALLTEYKASLITAAVTGELDVTTAGSSIPG